MIMKIPNISEIRNRQYIKSLDLADFDDFQITKHNTEYTIVTRFERNSPIKFKYEATRTLKKLFYEISAPLQAFWIVFSMLHKGFKVVPTGNPNTNTIYLNVVPEN